MKTETLSCWPSEEDGIEAGVSASFAGNVRRIPLMAGGCNFPQEDPLAPSSVKKFYKGVYALKKEGDTLKWFPIGELYTPAAYGVSCDTPMGLFIAGGQNENGSLSTAYMLDISEAGEMILKELASAPVTIDNAYSASDGKNVYIVGGNADGEPSRKAFAYSLEHNSWKELPPMPGNPRVQPVAAVSGGKLYVWGGFAGSTQESGPSFETGGICLDLSDMTWSATTPATDANGNLLGLGGGVATTLENGRILATGGVNPDIFINALRKLPDGYLLHEPEWYRFNPSVIEFNPETQEWIEIIRTKDAARAGASIINMNENGILVLGGEIKPRIRIPGILMIRHQ